MINFKLTYKLFGERSILIEWPDRIQEDILKDILNFKEIIEIKLYELIVEINYAYNSILISYKNPISNFKQHESELKRIYKTSKNQTVLESRIWKIPVCYDILFGIDSEEIILAKDIDFEQLIALHTEPLYTVFFTGFLPGFLYLGGLLEELYFPRKDNPRLSVKKGSVAIGQSQTGIYPNESPGGWNVIGNSPIKLFNPNSDAPCKIKGGDKIKFCSISLEEHRHINQMIEMGFYEMESEVFNG